MLADLTDRISLGLAGGRNLGEDGDRRVPLINVRDVDDGRVLSRSTLATRSVSADADLDRYEVKSNDVVIAARGTQIKVALVGSESAGAILSANLISIRTKADLLPEVLIAYLAGPEGRAALLGRGRSSTSALLLTPKAIGTMSVPVPPADVQVQIAEFFRAAEDTYVSAITAAEQRRAVARAVFIELLDKERHRE
jgi:restriction endonuclease S subunit